MGGQWRQVLPAFLTFSYIFTWIKYYKYSYLDFSVGLLSKVCTTGDGWKQYLHPSLGPEGARGFLSCWKCRVLWTVAVTFAVVNGTSGKFLPAPNLINQAEMYLGLLRFVIYCQDSYSKLNIPERGYKHVTFHLHSCNEQSLPVLPRGHKRRWIN